MSTNISARYPRELTSYDFLKAAAVILMIIDHAGFYLYDDETWMRVIGRLCVPIWFFLIGYARTAEIPRVIWVGAVLVSASCVISGIYILPLNILFSIIIARLLREEMANHALHNAETLRGMYLILVLAYLPASILFEYGTLGFLFVVMGFMARNWEDVTQRIAKRYLILYVAMSFAAYWLFQGAIAPEISAAQILFLTAGLFLVALILMRFRLVTFPKLTSGIGPFAGIVRILGRRTLEIYVLHIIILRVAAAYLFPEKFPFMELKIISENVIKAIG
jgi:TraX protein